MAKINGVPFARIVPHLVLAVAAGLIVALRETVTNRGGSPVLELWLWPEMFDWQRLAGRLGYEYQGLPPAAVAGRALPRWILRAVFSATGLPPGTLNAWLQFASYWTGLEIVLRIARRWSGGVPMAAPLLAALWLTWGVAVPDGFWASEGPDSYPYDGPAFMFSAAGLLLVLRRQFGALAIAVLVGSTNKETMCWLVAAWFLSESPAGRSGFRKALAQSAVLGSCWLAAVVFARIGTAGGVQLVDPIYNLEDLYLAGRTHPARSIWLVLSLHVLALCQWRRLPTDLRRIYPAALVHVVGLFLMGAVGEFRLWAEILPLGSAAICCLWPADAVERPADPGLVLANPPDPPDTSAKP